MNGATDLSPVERRDLVQRIMAGTPLLLVAAEYGVTRDMAAGMFHRWLLNGDAGLADSQVAHAG